MTQDAGPPSMLLRLLVVDEQFSLLAIPSWFITGDFHDGEVGVAFAEDAIHLFQRAVCGFRVEEVNDWEYEGIAARKN